MIRIFPRNIIWKVMSVPSDFCSLCPTKRPHLGSHAGVETDCTTSKLLTWIFFLSKNLLLRCCPCKEHCERGVSKGGGTTILRKKTLLLDPPSLFWFLKQLCSCVVEPKGLIFVCQQSIFVAILASNDLFVRKNGHSLRKIQIGARSRRKCIKLEWHPLGWVSKEEEGYCTKPLKVSNSASLVHVHVLHCWLAS